MKRGKNYRKAEELFDKNKSYSIDEALEVLGKLPKAKFDEAVEAHIRLGIEAKKTDQNVRSSVVLPHGTGKNVKVVAFTEDKQKEAKEAGADEVGGEDLVEKIKNSGEADFDVAVATPEMMPKIAKIAKILGPKGIMPNAKTNTVGPKIKEMIEELKKGKVSFKNDDSGNIHQVIGRRSFDNDKLKENFEALMGSLSKNKPASLKGKFIRNVSLSSTMSPSIKISA